MNGYLKCLLGAIIGAATAGLWLVVDLLLPEPLGDFILFGLMGLTNAVIGWQVGRLVGKKRDEGKDGALIYPEEGLKTPSH